jgi:1,4-alpha-glucan branching enzyme
LLQEATSTAYKTHPGIMMIAEESTAWSGVTADTSGGGLGFGFKWNMGWMHDTLQYLSQEPVHRVYHHNEITFSILYAWSENFMLPLSHDEVVHGKGQLVNKFPGDRWQKLATLRALYGFMWAHPGKKLLFMGSEFAQNDEWNENDGLQWYLTEYAEHQGVQKTIAELNNIYRTTPALWEKDTNPEGFTWLVGNDGAANIVAFARWDENQKLIVVTNFDEFQSMKTTLKLSPELLKAWKLEKGEREIQEGMFGKKKTKLRVTDEGAEIDLDFGPWESAVFEVR